MIDKYSVALNGCAKATFTIPSTIAVQEFSTAQLQNSAFKNPIACFITCEGNNVRFAYGVDPVPGVAGTGVLGHILYATGINPLFLTNPYNIANFRFCSAVEQSDGDIQVTMYYEIGDGV